MTSQSEFGTIKKLIVKHARDAFQDPAAIAAQWQDLNYTAAPDFAQAIAEYDAFLELLRKTGCETSRSPQGARSRNGFNLCSRRSGGLRPRRHSL